MKYQPQIGDPNSDPRQMHGRYFQPPDWQMMESGFPVELGEGYESSGVCSELKSVFLFPDMFITSA